MNVVTAMGDEILNNILRKEEGINVIGFDIQYQDGIFEILEENKNIDFLILNINLIGNLNYEDLIDNIKEKNNNIKFIIILEKENQKIKNYLIKNNINLIFNKNDFNLENIINILNDKNNKNLIMNKNKKNNVFQKRKRHPFNLVGVGRFFSLSFREKSATPALNYYYPFKLIKKIKNKVFNKKIKIIKNNNYKINIILKIKTKNKKIKINKKLNLIKYENKILSTEDLKKEILKIIKEEL